jgi:hypothetical protein
MTADGKIFAELARITSMGVPSLSAAAAKPVRPFYPLHISTLVLLLPIVLLLKILIVPGVFSDIEENCD